MMKSEDWSLDHCSNEIYRHKFTDVVRILSDWLEPHGGLEGKEVLEFGCGEGTVALSVALQKKPKRVVGVEVLDVYEQCRPLAQENLYLDSLPNNLRLEKINPGQDLSHLGTFDVIYAWSVFEHVSQDHLPQVFEKLKAVLNPNGVIFLQIDPLFHSRGGSHLTPWISIPWGHLSLQADEYRRRFFAAPKTPDLLRLSWAVYLPDGASTAQEREVLWDMYDTLNKATAPQLKFLAEEAGLEIIRDFRTKSDDPIPDTIAAIFDEDILRTEQIVWLLKIGECFDNHKRKPYHVAESRDLHYRSSMLSIVNNIHSQLRKNMNIMDTLAALDFLKSELEASEGSLRSKPAHSR